MFEVHHNCIANITVMQTMINIVITRILQCCFVFIAVMEVNTASFQFPLCTTFAEMPLFMHFFLFSK